jgi:hypothetical protein
MDPDEAVCPQCGHGAREARERREQAKAQNPPPVIDLSHLGAAWANLPPVARRHELRARLRGADRNLYVRLAKWLGFVRRPTPPPARRVAARTLVLAAVVGRASLETRGEGGADAPTPLEWLNSLGIARELEPWESAFLRQPLGRAAPAVVGNASWRAEGLAVLAWALNRFPLPAYDEATLPESALASVGYGSREVGRQLLDAGVLRPAAEIERLAAHATVVTWRLRTFGLSPVPWHFSDYLRGHGAFKESWLDGLRFLDGDLAVGDRPITQAPAEHVHACAGIAVERHVAAYWLEGDDPVYSRVDPSTLLSAC